MGSVGQKTIRKVGGRGWSAGRFMNRIKNITRNMGSTVFAQMPLFLISFIVRKVFVIVLGEQYLGLNGLFSNILSVLSVVELGFGASITYSLYRPLAIGDREKVKSLMRLYRRAYRTIATLIIMLGASMTPFLDFFIEDIPDGVEQIELIYMIHVLYFGLPYFFAYKGSLLFADQKKYVETLIHACINILCHVVQLVLLVVFRNYILYAACLVLSALASGIWTSVSVNRRYPFLLEKDVQPLSKDDKAVIQRNVGAMVFHRFGMAVVSGTDNILMAKFVSLAAVGRYSNYMVITNALYQVLERFYGDIMASMGNLNAIENDEKKLRAFNNQHFFSAWLIGLCAICLRHLYNPFITLWLGEDYLFSQDIVAVIAINFYITYMRRPVVYTKDAMGLFWYDRFVPLIEVALNFALSLILSKSMGVRGILWGTAISMVLVPFWIQPVILYRRGLNRNPVDYFIRFGKYTAATAFAGWITGWLCRLLPGGVAAFILRVCVCAVAPNIIFFLIHRRTDEFQYLYGIVKRLLEKCIRPHRKNADGV